MPELWSIEGFCPNLHTEVLRFTLRRQKKLPYLTVIRSRIPEERKEEDESGGRTGRQLADRWVFFVPGKNATTIAIQPESDPVAQ